IVPIEIHVTGDVQIEQAVAVVIAESATGSPGVDIYAAPHGNVGKGTVAIVVVEPGGAEVRHEDVLPAIIVEVAHADARTPAVVRQARFQSDVGEGTVVVVVEEDRAARRRLALARRRGESV